VCAYVRVCVCLCDMTLIQCMCVSKNVSTGWRKILGCLIFIGYFSQKSPIVSGSLAENDLRLKGSYGSSPPCMLRSTEQSLHCVALSFS